MINQSHPVHRLLCVTDFYYENSKEIKLEKDKNNIGEVVLRLMSED